MDRIGVLDGGPGTSLVDKFGVTFDETMPLWPGSLLFHGQDTLYACQRDFVEAGVDVLLTATYQASIEGFARTKTNQHPPLVAVTRPSW
jgi:homocysteine S-methyltransferase